MNFILAFGLAGLAGLALALLIIEMVHMSRRGEDKWFWWGTLAIVLLCIASVSFAATL